MIYSKKIFIYLLTSEISFLLKKQYFFVFESHLIFLNRKKSLFEFKKFISKSNFRNFFLVNFFSINLMKFPLFANFMFSLEIFEKIFLYLYLKKRVFIAFNFKQYIFLNLSFSHNFLFSEDQNLNVLKEVSFKYFDNFSIVQKDFNILY
jgi:hypothetical protein